MTRNSACFALLLAAFASSGPLLAQEPAEKPPAPAAKPPAPADKEKEASGNIVLGGQYVNDIAERGLARFEEFQDVPEGLVLEFARFAYKPNDKPWMLSFTAMDAFEKDQRYFLDWTNPSKVRFQGSFVEYPRFYSSGSTTLWSGVGSSTLTLDAPFRQGAEVAAGSPTSPFASSGIQQYMDAALAEASPFDLRTGRNDFTGSLDFQLPKALTLSLVGRYETFDGTKPLGFGTYIRRQALSGVPNTGAGYFWRETIEARGAELVQPLDYSVTEGGLTLTWAKNGHSVAAGWFGSYFRNGISALYFDNPFEAVPGRASAIIFDPKSDQEPPSPFGNNNLRGLFDRSSVQLSPDNDYNRIFGQASFRLGGNTRLSGVVARATTSQDTPFQPYAENGRVVYSGVADLPGVVYAKDAALPQSSLGGEMTTTQADVRVTSRIGRFVALRAGYRYYDLEDGRPEIFFPGYSSSGDSYFRRGIGQKDAEGNPVLFNEPQGYTRQRFYAGGGVRLGPVTVDAEYGQTAYDYQDRQVEQTTDHVFKGTVRFAVGSANVNAYYVATSRDFEGLYDVGLEKSGVRSYDVWTREGDEVGLNVDVPLSDDLLLAFGGSYGKNEYPGAVEGYTYPYGLQDNMNGSLFAGLTYTKNEWVLGAWAGYDQYEWNSLQVTKTSLNVDYNPTNRWTRGSADDAYWIGFEAVAPLRKDLQLRADVNYQKFSGDWTTTNLAVPDVNSAVAYPFPQLSDSTLTVRASLVWAVTPKIGIEARYAYEPYRLNDFTWDVMQPYMQGVFKQTQSSPTDIGDMNVSRFLFLDSRYSDYTAQVASAFVHFRF